MSAGDCPLGGGHPAVPGPEEAWQEPAFFSPPGGGPRGDPLGSLRGEDYRGTDRAPFQELRLTARDYGSLREVFRPGHADYTWWRKYGIRDHRGGGRSSGRETVARVAAGAVAAKVLEQKGIRIGSRVLEIHGRTSPEEMEAAIADAIQAGDSVGGVVEVTAGGCPPGLGDPVFGKLDAMIGLAMLSIGAVKGVEIGDGFAAARVRGSEQNDQMEREGFLTNHAGGILGGISTGAEIVVRIAVKPTPSIAKEQRTVDNAGEERVISVKGRHDPCIVPRLVPVAEAMLALVLADALMEQEKIGTWVTGG